MPRSLVKSFRKFCYHLQFVLTKLTEKDICRFRAEVASRKHQRWKLPKARSQILFEEIQNGTHNFHRLQQEVTQLHRIRLKDILDFYAVIPILNFNRRIITKRSLHNILFCAFWWSRKPYLRLAPLVGSCASWLPHLYHGVM